MSRHLGDLNRPFLSLPGDKEKKVVWPNGMGTALKTTAACSIDELTVTVAMVARPILCTIAVARIVVINVHGISA